MEKKIIWILIYIIIILITLIGVVRADENSTTITLTGTNITGESTIYSAEPDTSHENIRLFGQGGTHQFYIKFNNTITVPIRIINSTWYFSTGYNDIGTDVVYTPVATNNSWEGSTLTWNNATADIAGTSGTSKNINGLSGAQSWDVTNPVNYSIMNHYTEISIHFDFISGSGGSDMSIATGSSLEIVYYLENPPNVSDVVILPSVAYTSTDLYCIGTYYDADADLENGSSFNWYLNNISVNVTTQTLYANTTTLTVGDEVICEYTPSDGLLNGTSINSSIVKIIVLSALSSGGVGTLAVGVYCPQDTFWNGTTCTLDSDKAMTDREKRAQIEDNNKTTYYIIGGFIALILLFWVIKRRK